VAFKLSQALLKTRPIPNVEAFEKRLTELAAIALVADMVPLLGEARTLNFSFENKLQRKFSPLYAKRVPAGWRDNTARQLPPYVDPRWIAAFRQVGASNVADFCLEMYRRMGLIREFEERSAALYRPIASPRR